MNKKGEVELIGILLLLLLGGLIFSGNSNSDYKDFMNDCKNNNWKNFNYTTQCQNNTLEATLNNQNPTYKTCIVYDRISLIEYCQNKWSTIELKHEAKE